MARRITVLTEEHKEKMRLGRIAAADARRAARLAEGAAEAPFELPLPADDEEFAPYELSAAEKREIEDEVRARLKAERRAAAKKSFAAQELDRQRRKTGEMPVLEELKKTNEELTSIYVQMPTYRRPNGGEHPPEPIIIDQKVYVSGRWYNDIPRAQAVYMLDLMDKARRAVNAAEGRSRTYFNPGTFQVVYQGGVAAGGGGAGASFDAIHKRPA